MGLGLALLGCACGGESEVAPRTPVNAQVTEPTCVAAPALQDGFPAAFAKSQLDDPYRVERAGSIDLGAIGDAPLNQEPIPHHLAAWEQPFPCDWTNTCRPAVIVCPWAAARPSL
jgi:hypothetical protein